jgi:thiamine pyrophosphate-dependent acetolactate synthase large subunit-like protein
MIAIGCRFTEVFTDWRRMAIPKSLIQIDLDPVQIGVHNHVTVGIVADAKRTLTEIRHRLGPGPAKAEWGTIRDEAFTARHPRPEWLIETLREAVPEDTAVFTDACEMGYRMQTDWPAYMPRRFFYPSNYITLGWAFPAAIGGAVAVGGGHVVALCGDGGFVMTSQELATVARYRLPVIVCIHNDSTYGAIKNIQRRDHQARYVDVDLNNPDFLALAAAYGIPSLRTTTSHEFRSALHEALDRDGPSLIEIPDDWRFLRDVVPAPSSLLS